MRENKTELISRNNALLSKLKSIVLENLENEQFGVNNLVKESGYSRSQLHRKVKLIKGKSISQFIRDTRLEEALKMILNDVGTISEIAYKVGFSSPTYFNRCFHTRYKYTPNVLAEKVRQNEINIDELLTERPARKKSNWQRWLIPLGILFLITLGFIYYSIQNPEFEEQQLSLAVLPLDNLSTDEASIYFSEGMHDAIIGALGKIKDLRVISRTSTLKYDSKPASVVEIAKKLDVKILIEGSVFYYEDSARVQLQVIEAFPEEKHLWAKEYHVNINDALKTSNHLVQEIAREINVSLSPKEETTLQSARTINRDTYLAYLKGMHFLNKSTPEEFMKGMAYLQEAIDKDPTDPMAYTGLALGYITMGHGPDPESRYWMRAKNAAEIAISLDSTIAEAYAVLAMVKAYYEFDWDEAERLYQKANEMNNNLAMSHFQYAWYLAIMGRYEEAVKEHQLAKTLDPLTPIYTADMGSLYYWLGKPEEGIIEIEQSLELDSNFHHAWWVLGNIYIQKEMYEEAIKAHQKAVSINRGWLWALADTYARAGQKDKTYELLAEIKDDEITSREAIGMVFIYQSLGELDSAFYWINFKPRDPWIGALRTWPEIDPLMEDPRFNQFLIDLGLPPIDVKEVTPFLN